MTQKRRRGNGEGSIGLRTDGRWYAAYTVDGKRRYLYAKTRKEAQQRLQETQRQLALGMNMAAERITVAAFLDFWLREVITPRVRPSTVRSYSMRIKLHLVPYLGTQTLQRLTPQHIVVYQNTMLRNGMSASAVRHAKQVLSMALKQAVVWGIVPRNVAALVTPPPVESRDHLIPAEGDITRLLDAATTTREEVIVVLGALLGLRNSEARALRWSDVDLQRGNLEVRWQLAEKPQGAPNLIPLKTKASRRSIPLPAQVVALLRRHHTAQLRERLAVASVWHDHDLVLCTGEGLSLSKGMLLLHFRRLCERAGLPAYRFHALRHTCASLMAANGVPIKTAMEILGHTDPHMTTQVYTHAFPNGKRQAMDGVGRLLAEAS